MRPFWSLGLLVLGCLMILPSAASAQATLAGVVKDSSGAVLPGVTVEAASPALIEKVRTTVTDGTGQYRIVDLRGGTYTITFTLTGFATIKKEMVQLQGEAITTMNADMRVGAVAETITVTVETPTVDVKATTKQQVMSRDLISALPTGRNYSSFGQLIAGVNTTRMDNGGALGDPMASLTIHGGRPGDQRVLQNGVNTMTLQAGGDIGIAVPNPGMASEVTVDTSAVSAEQSQGGIRINYIPRDGGNTFSGTSFATFTTNGMQADNLTADLKARGLSSATSIKKIYDFNPGFGGPIRKDRVWFYFTGRVNRADQNPGGAYVNANAYDPTKWTYVDDLSKPAYNRTLWTDGQIRLTMQATPKNKVGFTWDQQTRCSCPGFNVLDLPFAVSSTTSPEASANFRSATQRLLHAEWSSPVTNKLLVEALGVHRTERWGFMNPNTADASDFISPAQQALLQSGALVPVLDASTGHFFKADLPGYNNNWVPNFYFRASASYVTGGHQFKVGFTDSVGYLEATSYNYSPYSYITNIVPGVPLTLIQENVLPRFTKSDQHYDLGIFAQDRWTMNRLTLNLGVRFDTYESGNPAAHVVGKTPLTPNRPDLDFPEQIWNTWKDITPRLGLNYDVTGDGKTAVKVTLNKYLQSQTVGPLSGFANPYGLHPVNRLINQTTRLWLDAGPAGIPGLIPGGGVAGDFIPQCDLTNPAANGECGPMANPNFGLPDASFTFAHDLEFGWGKRPFNWEFGTSVQREILPRVSMDFGYFRRWYGNFIAVDNTALSASDFTQYSVTAPTLAGLSTSGETITGFFDPNSHAVSNLVERVSELPGSPKQIEHWNGFDLSVNARLENGLLLFGGLNSGKTTLDTCEVMRQLPEMLNTTYLFSPQVVRTPLQFCHTESGLLTQVKLNGTYTVPKADVLVSATFQSVPGPAIRAQENITQRAPGQPLTNGSEVVALTPAFGTAFLTVVGADHGDRLNQIDLRVAKVLRYHKTRTMINFDVFNLFNRSAVTAENTTAVAGAFRTPTDIMLARFVKIGAQFEF